MENELLREIKVYWDGVSDSDWYQSLRTEARIARLTEQPTLAFHPAVVLLIRKYMPNLKGKRILLPSSGDNHAAFAFALRGADVTSSDISERQLDNAKRIADRLRLDITFVCDDTMTLSYLQDESFDAVYTSNGTLSWISDLDDMYTSFARVLKPNGLLMQYDVHPFNRPFSGHPWKEPKIVKSYHDVMPDFHWRVQDLVNAQISAGFNIREMSELPAMDASFWYKYDELKHKTPEELENINDWRKNPMAALPAWLVLVSEKGEVKD